MYTLMPYRKNNEVSRRTNGFFDDPIFNSFFNMGDWFGSSAFRVDVKDNGDEFELQAELPGVKQEDIDLSIKDDTLTISTEFKKQRENEHNNYVYSERRSGKFMRSFDVSGIQQDAITADYSDGVLTVKLPKVKPQQPVDNSRKITINSKPADTEAK